MSVNIYVGNLPYTYTNDDEGRAAINEFNGQEVGGRRLNVNEARPREPRR